MSPPNAFMRSSTCRFEPSPMPTSTMTDEMPITSPSMVRAVRNRLRAMLESAVLADRVRRTSASFPCKASGLQRYPTRGLVSCRLRAGALAFLQPSVGDARRTLCLLYTSYPTSHTSLIRQPFHEPLGECKDDMDICFEFAKYMDVDMYWKDKYEFFDYMVKGPETLPPQLSCRCV